jgi:hypothetical protein
VTALLKELAVIGVALLGIVGAVWGLGDRGALVPPPEMVVEEFVRELSLERWEPARTHLAESVARHAGPDSLRGFLQTVEGHAGRIEDVRGRPFFATDVAAEATAEITSTEGRRSTLRLPLARERGLWKISRLDPGG